MRRNSILLLFPILAACSRSPQPDEVRHVQACLGQRVDAPVVQALSAAWGLSTNPPGGDGHLISATNGITLLFESNIVWRASLIANPPPQWERDAFPYTLPFGIRRAVTPPGLIHQLGTPKHEWDRVRSHRWLIYQETDYTYVFWFHSNTLLSVWIDETESNKFLDPIAEPARDARGSSKGSE